MTATMTHTGYGPIPAESFQTAAGPELAAALAVPGAEPVYGVYIGGDDEYHGANVTISADPDHPGLFSVEADDGQVLRRVSRRSLVALSDAPLPRI
jgi:hypothetical protein